MQLSNSAIGLFIECKRCFYLDRKLKIPRPRGIFPSLPNGVDLTVKARIDQFRGQLPPELQTEKLEGWRLFEDTVKLRQYRQWNSSGALKYTDKKGNVLVGALDDILAGDGGLVAPLDFKTKGSEPELEHSKKYYQRQLDLYALLLSTQYDVAEFGALLYFWPVECKQGLIRFASCVHILDVAPSRCKEVFDQAIALLGEDKVPAADNACEFCRYVAAQE